MADSVASTQSRPQRAASKKRRQATVPTETENKLARAARSAQRLAQLSDASRDDSTLDLFPDDPTRATLEAMNIDIRQGTLHGFELPDVVLAAVGAIDGGDGLAVDARATRRAPRVAKADDQSVPVNALLSGLEIEPLVVASPAGEPAAGDAKPAADTVASAEEKSAAPARDASATLTPVPLTPAMAAATVARSVTALRQAAEPDSTGGGAAVSNAVGGKAPQRFAATFVKAASASASQDPAGVATNVTGATDEPAAAQPDAATEGPKLGAVPNQHGAPTEAAIAARDSAASETSMNSSASAQANAASATPWREARRAEAAAAAPELDRLRATAFADTVDALYGVIADQRHAATDHSRRMKWMLSIVVGALLVTVAIGITQTLLLMRLTRETTAQQHRIEQMMQNQQAAMASLLDTHMAMATAAAANAASDAAAATPAAPQQAAATATHARRAARAQHVHKQKAVAPH
ncbi:hypothetical protein [Paraburkholderia phytofirmans]|uniref:Cell wall surface anchor family protein n=1 Tax=Paraburkholderia phytofirmans (strain DSM 17436 / LMG 22146 / PsJN) TaxID=398527 RepID=B2T9U2_PARPJ|nr:hypothetical protein [Paraburkholderia phytofirmans]ACD21194.1 conserved hypothetical protein [Paraburkholderia phytofirmans PsJN]